jgi:hypothetical protein
MLAETEGVAIRTAGGKTATGEQRDYPLNRSATVKAF